LSTSARRPRLLPGLATGLAALLALSACGGGTDESAAGGEGAAAATGGETLVLYSGRNEALVGPLIERFRADTGVDVEVRYAGTAELAAQLQEEGEATPADVFLAQDAGALGALDQAGRFAPLPQDTLDLVDPRYRAQDGGWVGVSGRARVVVYDPGQVPAEELPDSVFDLTDERYRGEVGIAPTNASFQAFVTGMRVTAGEERTREWLEGLVANDVQRYENNIAVLDAADRGEIQLGLINHYYWYERVAEVGEDAVTARLEFLGGGDPGALVNVAGVGVLEGTDRPDEAQQLVDYLLSEPAQTYFADETFEYPLAAGVEPSADLPPLAEVGGPELDLAQLESLEETLVLLDETGVTS